MPKPADDRAELGRVIADIHDNLWPCARMLAESAERKGDAKRAGLIAGRLETVKRDVAAAQQRLVDLIHTYHGMTLEGDEDVS